MSESIISKTENGKTLRICYLTGSTQNLDLHHIMNGSLRKKSDEFGLWVFLRHDVHMKLHQTAQGQKVARWLKQQAQEQFERRYGHDKWMKEFHKNYL